METGHSSSASQKKESNPTNGRGSLGTHFDLKEIITTRQGENYRLHDQYVNSTLVKVLRTIGFDKVYARAEGAYLYDMDGKEYLDFLSGYGVYNVGRNHPVVKKAIQDVLSLDLPNMVQMDCALLSGLLGEALIKRCPFHLDAVFFCNSGTESVEGALKFARVATGRSKILALEGSYHGLSYGSLSVTSCNSFRESAGPFLPGVEFVPLNALEQLEKKLKTEAFAAFIAEPIQGKGVNLPEGSFFKRAEELCRQHGTLFICDEVQTGFGRTGKMFAHQHWDLEPDIMTLAKALSGGYVPAAAIVMRREIYQSMFSRMDRCVAHSTTFGRNNLAMACGLATLQVLEDEHLVENSAIRGDQLISALKELQSRYDIIKEVRGKGLMIGIEFQQPSSFKMKMAWKGLHCVNKGLFPQMLVSPLLQKHRILSQVAGHNMDVIKILPPLIIGEKEVHRFVDGMEAVINGLTSLPGPLWSFGSNLVKAALKSGYQSKAK